MNRCPNCHGPLRESCLNAFAAELLERLTGYTRDIDNRSCWWRDEEGE
jgi:hypothetical protein